MNTEPESPSSQRVRIAQAALRLFLARGIKKTSMDDVAQQTGLTRVTVYRYYGNRRALVRAAFWRIVAVLETARQAIECQPAPNIEAALNGLAQGIATLPPGDLPTCLDELSRLYPDLHAEFHQARQAAIQTIFERLYQTAEQSGRLRQTLNREVVRAYFSETVVNVLRSPLLLALDLPPTEIFATVQTIFLHGIFKEGD